MATAIVVLVAASGFWASKALGFHLLGVGSASRDALNATVQHQPRVEANTSTPPTLTASSAANAAPRPVPRLPGPSLSKLSATNWPGHWGFDSVLPEARTLAELNAMRGGGDAVYDRWASQRGGFDLGNTKLRVVLQGVDRPVVVVNVHANIVQRREIPTTTLVFFWAQGAEDPLLGTLNLDGSSLSASFFANHTVSLRSGESITIDIEAIITKTAAVWDLAIDYVVAGRQQTLILTRENGQHFRTAAYPQTPSAEWKAPSEPEYTIQPYRHGFWYNPSLDPSRWTSCVPIDCQR